MRSSGIAEASGRACHRSWASWHAESRALRRCPHSFPSRSAISGGDAGLLREGYGGVGWAPVDPEMPGDLRDRQGRAPGSTSSRRTAPGWVRGACSDGGEGLIHDVTSRPTDQRCSSMILLEVDSQRRFVLELEREGTSGRSRESNTRVGPVGLPGDGSRNQARSTPSFPSHCPEHRAASGSDRAASCRSWPTFQSRNSSCRPLFRKLVIMLRRHTRIFDRFSVGDAGDDRGVAVSFVTCQATHYTWLAGGHQSISRQPVSRGR